MPLSLFYSLFGIGAVWSLNIPPLVEGYDAMNSTFELPLIENASTILCSFHTNNHDENKPLDIINNDGILMFLVIIIRDTSQKIDLSILRKESTAKHLSHVIILVTDSGTVTEAWLRRAFSVFWRIWFLNIVIMFRRNNELHIYRYNPFAHKFLIKIELSNGALPRLEDLYPKKLPDMGGKLWRICMYHDDVRAIFENANNDQQISGSDGFMSAFIAERLNATRVVHRVSSLGNFTLKADICFKEITNEIDDAAFNIRFLSAPSFIRQAEYTIVQGRDDLCVLVPKAQIATSFWNLFRSFTASVWLTILLSIPLAYIFSNLVHLRLHKSEFDLLQLYATTLTLPATRIPTRTPLRIFFFHWIFYCMLICNAFKGNLTSNLVLRTYRQDLNTLKDLAESRYDLLTFARHTKHLDNFLNLSDPYEAIIKRKSIVLPDEEILDRIQRNNRSFAYLQKYHFAVFHAGARIHSLWGRPIFHVMSACLVPFHAVYIVPYGSPYLGFINKLIRSSLEFGFINHWESLTNAAFIETGKKTFRNPMNDDDPVVLKLAHFQAAFGLLFIGLALAIMIFLWEMVKHGGVRCVLAKIRRSFMH